MGANPSHRRSELPGLLAAATVGVLLGGLLGGFEPVAGDPDRLYRPLKTELARALARGRLPFWSDRLGLGVPLVSESHVAAFYPPNLVAYRVLGVPAAYRLLMWLHFVALAAATYAYARRAGLTPWGGALASLSFTLCGFQAVHATHEPFYCLLPYLPLALLLADRYAASGRAVWLAALALTLGVQWTVGHFQIQTWTNGLVLLTGLWRVAADGRPWRRGAGLAAAVGWGGAVAAVQLALSWDMARAVGHMTRTLYEMSFFAFPPTHWVEAPLPWFFRGLKYGADSPYYLGQNTTGFEAVFYVGTVPLILAVVGALDLRRGGAAVNVWRLVAPLGFGLATMPYWWPAGYAALLRVPGLGYFRAPGRYTLLTSFALALLAGRGFDRAVGPRLFRAGVVLAVVIGLAAAGAGLVLTTAREFRSEPGPGGVPYGLATAALTWTAALAAVAAWRGGKAGGWLPAAVTAVELGALFYLGPSEWGWAVSLPARSPVLSSLAADPSVGRVGGVLDDLPLRAGLTTGTPYLGMTLAPLGQHLHAVQDRRAGHGPNDARWQRRFGVTHSVWDEPVTFTGDDPQEAVRDPALDALAYRPIGKPVRRLWRVVRHPDPFPAARVARVERYADGWPSLRAYLSNNEARDEAWFYASDLTERREPTSPARSARVVSWDGREAVVEHDGACVLVVTRTFDRDWRARVGVGPEAPVLRVDGGLQGVRLDGDGPSRVRFRYEPRLLRPAAAVSAVALSAALGVVTVSAGRRRRKDDPRA